MLVHTVRWIRVPSGRVLCSTKGWAARSITAISWRWRTAQSGGCWRVFAASVAQVILRFLGVKFVLSAHVSLR